MDGLGLGTQTSLTRHDLNERSWYIVYRLVWFPLVCMISQWYLLDVHLTASQHKPRHQACVVRILIPSINIAKDTSSLAKKSKRFDLARLCSPTAFSINSSAHGRATFGCLELACVLSGTDRFDMAAQAIDKQLRGSSPN